MPITVDRLSPTGVASVGAPPRRLFADSLQSRDVCVSHEPVILIVRENSRTPWALGDYAIGGATVGSRPKSPSAGVPHCSSAKEIR